MIYYFHENVHSESLILLYINYQLDAPIVIYS